MALLNYELEQAFVSLVGSATVGEANVYGGRSPKDKILPAVICTVDGEGEEDPKNSGNFWHTVLIQCKGTSATDTAGIDPTLADVTLADDAFTAVLVTDLDDQLNAQSRTLTVFPQGWITGSPRRYQDSEGIWIDELPIRVYCCASVLPA